MSRELCMVLQASAGTGKTFQLTNRLLRLYADEVNPERVLASTFTRKAAGEILERLIQRLCKACESDANSAELAQHSATQVDRARAIELTVRLLRHIERLRISTLDAWFQERVQQASFELALPADWEICDPEMERRLAGRALSRALERTRSESEWSTLIADLKRGNAESRVHAGLLENLGQAARFTRECTASAWEFPAMVADLSAQEFDQTLAALEGLEVPTTQRGTPRKNFEKALLNLKRCASAGDWGGFAELTLVQRVLDEQLQFDSTEIPPAWGACVRVLAQRAAHCAAVLVRRQNSAMRSLVADFVEELDQAALAEHRLSFDALPRLLALRADKQPALPDFDHLLLDEFQDTSSLQWRALEPGASSVIKGKQTSFFCVGDPKQSIYAWRDGNPLLLAQMSERWSLPSETLFQSHRSSKRILDFVNQVFENIADNAALKADPAAHAAAVRFQSSFKAHEPALQLEGRVRMWCGPEFEDKRNLKLREDARMDRGVELALELHRAYPEWKLALLLRNKKLVPALLERLKRAGLEASGEGGNPLTDSGAVNAALSLLEFADHPADEFLAFHLMTSPLARHAGLSIDAQAEECRAASLALRKRWIELGPAEFLAELEPLVLEHYDAFDRRRFAQLLALAQRLEPTERLRPAQFAARLALERVPDPASSRIKVMTVHGAKGLEFDAVLLLDLDLSLKKGGSSGLVARRRGGDPREPYDVVSHPLRAEEAPLLPDLFAVQTAAKTTRMLEELCVLYVALTRAVHHIEMLIDFPGKDLAKCSFGGILLQAVGVDEIAPSSWVPLDEDWAAPLGRSAAGELPLATSTDAQEVAAIRLRPGNGMLARRAPSQASSGAQAKPSRELFRASVHSRRRGMLWHAWLERIEWIEGAQVEPELLLSSAHECGYPWVELRDAEEFSTALAHPEVQRELSRAQTAARLGAEPGDLQLFREHPFSFVREADGGRELVPGILDRAVVARPQRRGEVVDFKSDAIAANDEAALRAHAESYRGQLESYRAALSRLECLDETRISMRVCFVAAGRTLEL